MKKTMLFSAALAGLMLGACSSSDDLNSGGTGANENGSGYIALSLNLPTRSGTVNRAANDDFQDGTTNEYEVKNGTLILFEGTDESSATFTAAYKLNNLNMNMSGTTTDNITTNTTITQKLNNGLKNANNKFYAIVVLNDNGTLAVDDDNATLKVNNEDFDSAKKISDLYGLQLTPTSAEDWKKVGFLMMNAPLSSVKGGSDAPTGAKVITAAEIDKDHVYDTEALAKANTSANVYVERALAKVDVTADATTGQLTDNSKAKYEIKGWILDNTNKKSYYLRNTASSDKWLSLASNSTLSTLTKKYRFVGDNAVENGVSLYRTYWAQDPNYDTKPTDLTTDFNTIGGSAPTSLKNLGDVDYCLENTFTVGQQNQDVTTRVIVAAQIQEDGKTFYVVNDNENSLLTEENMKKAVKEAFLNNTTVQNWIKNGLKTDETIGEEDLDVTVASTAGNNPPTININFTGAAKYTSGTAPATTQEVNGVITGIKVATYANGISYYPVRIKHFGDDLTPWRDHETPDPTVSTGAYPDENKEGNYLGRYGVLRNNWYNVEVTGIKKLGSPVVPKVTGETDDELAAYISVKINVLSWAKRTQSTILGQ